MNNNENTDLMVQKKYVTMEEGVTVAVPVYNGEKYLVEFLKSLEGQTYRPIEVIIRDDNSKDHTLDICEAWKERVNSEDFAVKIIAGKSNHGLTSNVSEIIKYATRQYIVFADQDDIWLPHKIEKQLLHMNDHPNCSVCLCDRSVSDKNLKIRIESEYNYKGYRLKSMHFEDVISHSGCYAANTMMIRNYGNKILHIPHEIVCYDIYLAIIASVKGSVDYLFDPLLIYRIHDNNLSSNYKAESSNSFLQLLFRRYRSCVQGRDKYNKDGEILEKRLRGLFGIELSNYKNVFDKKKKFDSILKKVWNQSIADKKKGIIGLWR